MCRVAATDHSRPCYWETRDSILRASRATIRQRRISTISTRVKPDQDGRLQSMQDGRRSRCFKAVIPASVSELEINSCARVVFGGHLRVIYGFVFSCVFGFVWSGLRPNPAEGSPALGLPAPAPVQSSRATIIGLLVVYRRIISVNKEEVD